MDACRNEELLTQLNWRSPAQSQSTVQTTLPPSPSPISDRFTLVKSTLATPADFLLLSYLSCRLHAGEHVLLVHSARSRQHYIHTGRKWNVNIAQAEAAQQLSLIDAHSSTNSTAYSSSKQPTALHTHILQHITQHTTSHPLHLVIDDLTLLTLLTPIPVLHSFLSRLRHSTASLLILTSSDIPNQHTLQHHLSQYADCMVAVSALRMGASRDVDGVVEIVKRDVYSGIDNSRVVLFYRLTANGINLSSKGAQT